MKRLTTKTPDGVALDMGREYASKEKANEALMPRFWQAVERLAAYEDTGLEPDDVTDLMAAHGTAIGQLTEYRALDSIAHLRELVQAEQDEEKVYRLALDAWGADTQTLMVFEEMSELQKELCKHARGKDNREEISEEIADLLIMLDQMMILHDCKQTVKKWKQRKLKRLTDRLTREKAEKALEGEK